MGERAGRLRDGGWTGDSGLQRGKPRPSGSPEASALSSWPAQRGLRCVPAQHPPSSDPSLLSPSQGAVWILAWPVCWGDRLRAPNSLSWSPFFRASPGPGPARAPRAVRPLKRRPPKRTNELPPPNKLPGIFGEPGDGGGDGAPLASARSGRRSPRRLS